MIVNHLLHNVCNLTQEPHMSDDLIWTSAHELANLYRSRTVSPVEVVDAVLERQEAVNPQINAFVTVTADQARDQAKHAERRLLSEPDLPPLFGVPITVKDLTETAGVRTTFGSVAYVDNVPSADGIAWSRLKAAGTILIGKTTTPEFGLLGVTESKLTGTTGTPWDPSRAAGGSSGGAAAATAAGIAPLAWGSDGGGSIRVPSSLCGTVGVKPTSGRIPHNHNVETDSTEGPIARSVVDAAMMLDVTVGPDPRDRIALPPTGDRYAETALVEGDLTGVRIAASPDLGQLPIDPETRRVFNSALDDLRSFGAHVETVEISLPDAYEYFIQYWGPEYIAIADEMHANGLEVWPLIDHMAEKARRLSPVQVSQGMREVKTAIYEAYAKVFAHFDLLVTPTTPIPAFPHAGDKGGVDEIDGQLVKHAGAALHSLTESPSHAGLPALTLPCGFTDLNLPVGLQFIGPIYADLAVISAAARYEHATTWHRRHPTL